jgi:hypothetical protein
MHALHCSRYRVDTSPELLVEAAASTLTSVEAIDSAFSHVCVPRIVRRSLFETASTWAGP